MLLPAAAAAQATRPTIGVAFGGGSARGIAHVGVIRWFEEHRIPIDVAAGTSMGGLIGGAFATGMDAAELAEMLERLDWDRLFGTSNFEFRNIRRKADGRAYPARLEFGLKRGIVPPTAINSGGQVDLLVTRIAAPYYGIQTFDELPTPFRTVAVDLLTATRVVLERGSLASAMRATMSLPLIFPPVELDGRVLVDGGALDNVPADVVRAMNASRVIAVNVGDLADLTDVNYSLLGLASQTVDAMMRANTRAALASADIVINVPLADYGSLDWRRSRELVEEGYAAAESMRERLLPLAVGEAEYAQWKAARQARRRTALPSPAFIRVNGFVSSDERDLGGLLTHHVGVPLDIDRLEADLATLSGLDRYESIAWRLAGGTTSDTGLVVEARPKPYGPPFLMLSLNLENTTSQDFRVALSGRYLAYDFLRTGTEMRIDGTIGSDPSVAAALYTPLGRGPWFVSPYAGVVRRVHDSIQDSTVVASYQETSSRVGVEVGINLGRLADLRVGGYVGRLVARVRIGEPGLPDVTGKQTVSEVNWRHDGQDSPVIPSRGTLAYANLRHVFDSPEITPPPANLRSSAGVTQLSGEANRFWTVRERDRLFVLGGGGTSFDHTPLPTDQFVLGRPFHLGAYDGGELRGDHYYILTAGYLRQFGRLPDFLGGPIFLGGWLDTGDAFDDREDAELRSNVSGGAILDTLIGPAIFAGSAGFDGRWRLYVGVGRIFRGSHR